MLEKWELQEIGRIVERLIAFQKKLKPREKFALSLICKLLEKLTSKDIWLWIEGLRQLLSEKPSMVKHVSRYLCPIQGAEHIVIGPNEKGTLAKTTSKIFCCHTERDWGGIDKAGPPTKKVAVEVYKARGSIVGILEDLHLNPDKLCLTRAQIKSFIVNHHQWIKEDLHEPTAFLLKSHAFFVVFVRRGRHDDEFWSHLIPLEDVSVYIGGFRLVLPKLTEDALCS